MTMVSRRRRVLGWLRDWWPIFLFLFAFSALYIPVLLSPYSTWDVAAKVRMQLALLLPTLLFCIQFLRADLGGLPTKQRIALSGGGLYFVVGCQLLLFAMFTSTNLHITPFYTAIIAGAVLAFVVIPAILYLADRLERRFGHRRLSWRTHAAWGILLSLLLGTGAWFVRAAPELIPTFTYRGHTSDITALAWSPDGRRIASGDYQGNVLIWDAFTGEHVSKRQTAPTGYDPQNDLYEVGIGGLSWSPDGRRIAVCSQTGRVEIWNESAVFQLLLTSTADCTRAAAWSPEGDRIATTGTETGSSGPTSLQVWDASTGKLLVTSQLTGFVSNDLAWSPDGTRLAALTIGKVDVIDSTSGATLWTAASHLSYARGNELAWPPDGKEVELVSNNPVEGGAAEDYQYSYSVVLEEFAATSGALLLQKTLPCEEACDVFFRPDGRFLAATGRNDEDNTLTLHGG